MNESDSEIVVGNQAFDFGIIPYESTGIIKSMNYKELREKVQQINSETTSNDLFDLFGAYPGPLPESGVNRHVYYCGDYTVNMFGLPIVSVSILNGKTGGVEILYDDSAL